MPQNSGFTQYILHYCLQSHMVVNFMGVGLCHRMCWGCNQGISVSIETELEAGWLEFDSWQGEGFFLFTTESRLAMGTTQPPIQWVLVALSPGTKQLRLRLHGA